MYKYYSFSELIKNIYSFLITKLTVPQARLIRRPIYLRGRKSMCGCNRLTTGRFCRFDLIGSKKTLFIGDDCEFGDMTHIVAYERVKIGNGVLIASKCFISDTNHGSYKGNNQCSPSNQPKDRVLETKTTIIGDNVWIGENVVILPGSEIGDGCIIGANSLVNCIIPKNSIAVGNPAKVIKKWNGNNWEINRME